MTLKSALTGALAPLLLAAPAWAEIRTAMAGAEPILPAGFTPRHGAPDVSAARPFTSGLQLGSLQVALPGSRTSLPGRFVVALAPRAIMRRVLVSTALARPAIDPRRLQALVPSPDLWRRPTQVLWQTPLLDRTLSASEKALSLAGDLIEAVARIEPLFDPTRLDGPETEQVMAVSSGTASMDSVFADRWHRAYADPNINAKVAAIALAWEPTRRLACEDFIKARPHPAGEPALTALDAVDCQGARHPGTATGETPEPIAIAQASLPVFAAPLPGARLSRADFWAKRQQRIAAVEAELRLRQAQQAMRLALDDM